MALKWTHLLENPVSFWFPRAFRYINCLRISKQWWIFEFCRQSEVSFAWLLQKGNGLLMNKSCQQASPVFEKVLLISYNIVNFSLSRMSITKLLFNWKENSYILNSNSIVLVLLVNWTYTSKQILCTCLSNIFKMLSSTESPWIGYQQLWQTIIKIDKGRSSRFSCSCFNPV